MGKLGGRGNGLQRVSSPAQNAALLAEAQGNTFASARELKVACCHVCWTEICGYFQTKRSWSQNTMRCGDSCTYRPIADSQWGRVTFSDEFILTSANDEPTLVYRKRGQLYSYRCVLNTPRVVAMWCVRSLLGSHLA
jgi:hypothetical protein